MKITEGNLKAILEPFKLSDIDVNHIFTDLTDTINQKYVEIDIFILNDIMLNVSNHLERKLNA